MCRPAKVSKKTGKAPVEMSIIISGQRCILTLPRKEDPKVFKKALESKRKSEIKSYCEEVYTGIQSKIFQMQLKRIPLSIENLKKFIQSGFTDSYTLRDLFQEYSEILESRVHSGNLSKDVYKKYQWAWDYFLSNSGVSEEFEVSSVSSAEIIKFTTYLESKYQNETAIGYYRKIQTIFKFAFESGKIPKNPCALVKIKKQKKDAIFLTEPEVEKIQRTDYKNESLNHYRDLFIFQVHTCLSYSDLRELSWLDVMDSKFGKYIKKPRKKTGVEFTVLLDSVALGIWKKYNYDLQVPSPQKYNTYLKNVADLAGIKKKITTHTARHSGAVRLINNGTELSIVSKILGHTSELQTKEYARLLDVSVLKSQSSLEERRLKRILEEGKIQGKVEKDKEIEKKFNQAFSAFSPEQMDEIMETVFGIN
jgi:integrase